MEVPTLTLNCGICAGLIAIAVVQLRRAWARWKTAPAATAPAPAG